MMTKISLADVVAERPLTLSVAAWLLARFKPCAFEENELCMLQQGISAAIIEGLPCCPPPPNGGRIDPRCTGLQTSVALNDHDYAAAERSERRLKVYTDYQFALETLKKLANIVDIVDNAENADLLFIMDNIKNFLNISRHNKVCQFPYEGGLVRKDLLPLTIRRYCYRSRDGDHAPSTEAGAIPPDWWLPCFDLTTEFHLFAAEHTAISAKASDGTAPFPGWIIKPAQGARGKGHRIVTLPGPDGLFQAAQAAPQLPAKVYCDDSEPHEEQEKEYHAYEIEREKVAQLLVLRPLLALGKKFDVRIFVFVRSFVPFEAYMHELVFARLANKPYSCKPDDLHDSEISLTVCAYAEDPALASKQSRLTRSQLKRVLEEENPGFSFDELMGTVEDMMGDLFGGVAPSIGHWPSSCAYYSIDVIFDAAEFYDDSVTVVRDGDANATAATAAALALKANKHTPDRPESDNIPTDKEEYSVCLPPTPPLLGNGNDGTIGSTSQTKTKRGKDKKAKLPQPKLVEINFMGDWKGAQAAAESEEEFHLWVNDLITCLARTDEAPDLQRCHRLVYSS